MLQVSSFCSGSSDEIFSFSFGGSANNLLAAGCNSQVLNFFWLLLVSCLYSSLVL